MEKVTGFKTKVKLQYAINLLKTLDLDALDEVISHLEGCCDNLEQETVDAEKMVQLKEDMNKRLTKRRRLC